MDDKMLMGKERREARRKLVEQLTGPIPEAMAQVSTIEFNGITVTRFPVLADGKASISIQQTKGKPRMLIRGDLDLAEDLLNAALGGVMRAKLVSESAFHNGKHHHQPYKEEL